MKEQPTSPRSEVPKDSSELESPADKTSKGVPVGAILVTSFLALMILISWFGMYLLDFLRG